MTAGPRVGRVIGFGPALGGDLDAAERREWLVTDGLGRHASGTAAGLVTRRHHGLLVARPFHVFAAGCIAPAGTVAAVLRAWMAAMAAARSARARRPAPARRRLGPPRPRPDGGSMEFAWFVGLFIDYGYLLVFVAVFLDNAGLPLPGELALLAFGFLARMGHVNFGWGLVAAGVGAMAGDTMSYWLGRLAGARVLRIYCRVTLGSGQCVEKAQAFYGRFGRSGIVVGRFALGVRAFLMPLAGSARLPYGQFLVFDAIGAAFWSGAFLGVGSALGNQVEAFSGRFRQGEVVLGSALGIAAVVYLGVKLWRRRRYGAVIQNARVSTSSSDTSGWYRIPPFPGPRLSSYRTRYPVNTLRSPPSRRTGIATFRLSFGRFSRSMASAEIETYLSAGSSLCCARESKVPAM